ncbi:MAG: orotidine-5'-phosphate decarboxylase [Candidatus Cloacimonetes bacterium]|nr:orotidine-5'-phosphate decarboxylase [Candidatus Cloacimonadota bacterium]
MARSRSRSFWDKYRQRWEATRSLLCIGLDSAVDKLPAAVQCAPNPIWEFNRRIIDATCDDACAYKPNLAFYLADGNRGCDALHQTIQYIPDDIPVILDCKAGDIGNTMESYANAFFDGLGADAITLNPLMGANVIEPVLTDDIRFAFALVLTSNPTAADFLQRDGLAEHIAGWLNQFPLEQIGAVVGATHPGDLRRLRQLMPGRIFLIPGIGAQGGDLAAVMKHASDRDEDPNILINSSRGIIFADRSRDFAGKAKWQAHLLREAIHDLLQIT